MLSIGHTNKSTNKGIWYILSTLEMVTYEILEVLEKAPVLKKKKLKILEGIEVIRVLSTSSVTGTILCLGYTPDEPERHAACPRGAYVFVKGDRQKQHTNNNYSESRVPVFLRGQAL